MKNQPKTNTGINHYAFERLFLPDTKLSEIDVGDLLNINIHKQLVIFKKDKSKYSQKDSVGSYYFKDFLGNPHEIAISLDFMLTLERGKPALDNPDFIKIRGYSYSKDDLGIPDSVGVCFSSHPCRCQTLFPNNPFLKKPLLKDLVKSYEIKGYEYYDTMLKKFEL